LNADIHVCEKKEKLKSFVCDTWLALMRDIVNKIYAYRVATISRLLEIVGLFCKRTL